MERQAAEAAAEAERAAQAAEKAEEEKKEGEKTEGEKGEGESQASTVVPVSLPFHLLCFLLLAGFLPPDQSGFDVPWS